MPQAVIAAVGAYAGSAAAAYFISEFAGALVTAAVWYFGNKAYYGVQSPSRPLFTSEAQGRQIMVRSSIEPRRVIYGEVGGLSGPLLFAHVTREPDLGLAWEVSLVPFSAPFQVAVSKPGYHSTKAVYVHTGDPAAEEELTPAAGAPGPNEYAVSSTGIHTFHAALAGRFVRILYNERRGESNAFFHLVIALAGHEVEEIGDVHLGTDVIRSSDLDADGNVVAGKYAHYVRIKKHLGAEDQEADPDLVAESEGLWTPEHRGRGIAYIYVRLRRHPDLFPNGVPPIRATVKGAKLYDPRTGTTAWSNNWALAVYDYLTKPYGLGCDASEINETSLNAAANIADEDVEIDDDANTQKRYTVDGTFGLDERPLDVLKKLVAAGAGGAIYSVNTWDVHAGAYTAPTETITVSDLRGPISGRADVERRELFNVVRGTFTDPDRDWQPTDFPAVRNDAYIDADNGEEIPRDIDLPFTTDAIRAQRLAKIFLERARQSTQCQWPGKPKLFGINTWGTLNVEVATLGWSPKVFRVHGWRWQPGGGVDLHLQEEAEAIYDWNHGEATTHDPAPNTTLPNTEPVQPPGAPEVSEALVETRDGRGVAVEVTITCLPSPDALTELYQFEYKAANDTAWEPIAVSATPKATLFDVAPGVYDFRVYAITGLGRRSVPAQTREEILGLGAAPSAPTGLSIQAGGGTARLKIDPHPDLDVRRGGRILVRFCHEGVTPAWESAFSIGEPEGWPGDSTQIDVPLKPGTYLVKAVDSSGHESQTWAEISTKQASVLEFTTLDTVRFDPEFDGTHSGTAVVSDMLTLGGLGTFDDIPDFDAEPSIDGFGGVADDGTCTFATGLDLGSVARVRLTTRIEGSIDNVLDQIDERTGEVDDWLDWDGSSFGGSAADAWLEVRETDDDPDGSPSWSDWKRLDAAEFEARAFQFRARLNSSDPAYRPEIGVLEVKAEGVA